VSGEERGPVSAERALGTIPGSVPVRSLLLWGGLALVGAIVFAVGVGDDPTRAWATVWANFLFWTGLAMAGVMFGAVLQTAKGHWGKGFRRLAEGMGAFLPVSLVLLVVLLVWGGPHIFPWLGELDVHVNEEWLTADGVLWRNTLGVALLYAVGFAYLRLSLRPDAPLVADELAGWRKSLVSWIGRKWRGDNEELERSRRLLGRISPPLILLWAVVFTLLSVDLAMSLIPGFISVIWGALYFMGGWLTMLALLAILARHYRDRYDLADRWGRWEFHDVGKLLFAFTIFWAYLWWSQYLVIWYGNLGRETIFFEQRAVGEFGVLYWAMMALVFGLPFLLLLWRKPKMNPRYLSWVAMILLVGFWLQRHLLVLPSVGEGQGIPLGWIEAGVSLGFIGLFGLCYSLFASTFPKIPIRETLVGSASTGP
jgi:hypothetical protein